MAFLIFKNHKIQPIFNSLVVKYFKVQVIYQKSLHYIQELSYYSKSIIYSFRNKFGNVHFFIFV